MYGAETWDLIKADELRLGVFERKILRRMYGSVCEGVTWRSWYNEELYRLYDETDLVTTIRITRLRWAGHIVRMQDNLPCKKINLDKLEGRRRVGCQTWDGWKDKWGMQRGWELETGGSRRRTEMVGGDFQSRTRHDMLCSALDWASDWACKSSELYLCRI